MLTVSTAAFLSHQEAMEKYQVSKRELDEVVAQMEVRLSSSSGRHLVPWKRCVKLTCAPRPPRQSL